jgi:hypothetical protein
VFKRRALRRIFGPEDKVITENWRILHNEQLHNFYLSPNIFFNWLLQSLADLGLP